MHERTGPTDPSHLNSYPAVRINDATEIAPGITLIPDPRVNFVPNIGIIAGRDLVLVIDTGMGVENGRLVLETARGIAAGRPLVLTMTHFHPEHGYGAQVFENNSTIIYNQTQADELKRKGSKFLEMFRGYGEHVVRALEGVELVEPDETYSGEKTIDLGGRTVVLQELAAHTKGDQIIYLPDERIVFTGDLAENRFFPIFADEDSLGAPWITALERINAMWPSVVIPGHGEAGGAEIVQAVHNYLQYIQNEVAKLPTDIGHREADRRLLSVIKARYPDWDNDKWVSSAIGAFLSEAAGTRTESKSSVA
jgi:glyoxylase-like metal-dependent hydrolase (beta-lactamase superfamily II)